MTGTEISHTLPYLSPPSSIWNVNVKYGSLTIILTRNVTPAEQKRDFANMSAEMIPENEVDVLIIGAGPAG